MSDIRGSCLTNFIPLNNDADTFILKHRSTDLHPFGKWNSIKYPQIPESGNG